MAKDLQDIYNSGIGYRQNYLANAEALATITLPELRTSGVNSKFNLTSSYQPSITGQITGIYNNAGTQAVTGLASTMQAIHFPNQVDWFKIMLNLQAKAKTRYF